MQAVQTIAEQAAIQPPVSVPAEKKTEKKLILPKPYRYQTYAVSYLQNRGIDMELIQYCLKTGQIYESENYHNVVFVGMDQSGIPRYAALRGVGTAFVGEASGSDKNYSFCIPAEEKCCEVHLFESAIDLLSYATEQKLDGEKLERNAPVIPCGCVPACQRNREKQGSGGADTLSERASGGGSGGVSSGQ